MKLRQVLTRNNRRNPEGIPRARWRAMLAQADRLREPGNTKLREQAVAGWAHPSYR